MKNSYLLIVILLVVVVGFALYSAGSPSENRDATNTESSAENAGEAGTEAADSSETDIIDPMSIVEDLNASAKVFEVSGGNFAFDVKEIRVNRGDTVTINFTNTEGFHDWVIDEFNARTPRINAGATSQVTFVADREGTFEYYCSVGQHRANGMVGKLIVE